MDLAITIPEKGGMVERAPNGIPFIQGGNGHSDV